MFIMNDDQSRGKKNHAFLADHSTIFHAYITKFAYAYVFFFYLVAKNTVKHSLMPLFHRLIMIRRY